MKNKNVFLSYSFAIMTIFLMLTSACEKKGTYNPTTKKPELITTAVNNITQITASCGGNINKNGGIKITARGVCWSTTQNPTISDNKTIDGTGIGIFTSNLINLTANTTYYIRAYATNSKGTAYGNQKTFTTSTIPVLTTIAISDITETTASCGGNISSDENSNVTVRGICWSTTQNPTISDHKTTDGTGIGDFTSNLTGLTANTTYYVRAYAINSRGTAYGDEKSFTTQQGSGTTTTVTDEDGNVYNTIVIGTQTWMVENLKVTKYNDGSDIPYVTDATAWGDLTTAAYCWYENDENNKEPHGALYNWYVVNNNDKNICPIGWHIPTKAEYDLLISYLGGGDKELASKKLRERGTTYWPDPNSGTNESGFKAILSGYRDVYDAEITFITNNDPGDGIFTSWWYNSEADNDLSAGIADNFTITDGDVSTAFSLLNNRKNGFSVRCIKNVD
jgi:uncharacterized protein (TIGR02145 family)